MPLEPMLPLTDPEAWHRILVRSFLYHQDLAQIWETEIVPSLKIPYPFIVTDEQFDRLPYLAIRLKAFGLALDKFNLTNLKLIRLKENLLVCNNQQVMNCIGNIEHFLKKR
jgi:hypothetical protein